MILRALALLALSPWAGSVHAAALVAVDDAHGWCARVDDGDCREYFLVDDASLRIVHYGFEDGMRFDLFLLRGRRYSHQLSFEPVRPVGGRPGHYERLDHVDGFSPVVELAGDRTRLRYSFEFTLEDDMGEMPADRWQKRLPAVLFEPAGEGKSIDTESGEALPLQFESLTIKQATHRARQARAACPSQYDIDQRVIPCP